ncbi:hypothetical protein V8G54_020308 [Vigna mungo]|uniref:Uncharacterized protein n=1 Tax=Vigna mungo TaxID=3915 RepID=A0AAQ3RUK9_VIGMU
METVGEGKFVNATECGRERKEKKDQMLAGRRLYKCEGSLGEGTPFTGVLMYVTNPGFSPMSISSGFTPSAGLQLKWCKRWPNMEVTNLIPSWAPGQTRRPAPNGSSLKSCPFMSTSSSRNLSGRNSNGSFQTAGSRATAHTLTWTLEPLGMSYPPTLTLALALCGSMSGVGGWSLNDSFATHCRYGRLKKSASVITLSSPITLSSSSWAFCCTLGFLINSAMAHSTEIADVSVPAVIMSCELRKYEHNFETKKKKKDNIERVLEEGGTQRRPMMVSSLRSYLSCNVSRASTKCCLAPPDFFRASVCSSMIALVSLSRRAPCLAKASSSRGNIHRSQGMCSAMARDAPSFNPFSTTPLNSTPCSSNTPSEFTNLFPNANLVMLLNATSPKNFLTNIPFPKFSAQLHITETTFILFYFIFIQI